MSGEEPRELEQEQEAQGQGDDLEATGGIEPDAESVTAEPEAEQAAPSQIDLNTATEEELRQLPGIGAALASRIVSYRREAGPFSSPEGITAVSGVAGATYDGLAERLTVGPAEPQAEEGGDLVEPEPAPVEVEADEPEGVPVIVSESAAAEEEPAEAPQPEPEAEYVPEVRPRGAEPPLVEVVETRGGCWRLALVGVLAVLLGAALALALIFLVNGTLDFQSAAIRAAQDEVLRMEGLVGALDMKVAELEERIGVLPELDARVTEMQAGLRTLSADLDDLRQRSDALAEVQGALRQEFTNMREDMDGLADHVGVLDRRLSEAETQIAYLNRRIEIINESIVRFDEFLVGLQALLNQSLEAAPPTPTPWVTPVNTPTPQSESNAGETRAPRPQATVIPLSTRTPQP